jgi:hypothetical protein
MAPVPRSCARARPCPDFARSSATRLRQGAGDSIAGAWTTGSSSNAILLDNADLPKMKEAASRCAGRVPLEISGGVSLETVGEIAAVGNVLISVGRLTHSAPALDIALEVSPA